MKSDNLLRHVWVPFLFAVIGYAVVYAGIEHRRTRNGPWLVTFTNNVAGDPTLLINQPKLGITNLQITFPGETNTETASFAFSQPREVPWDVPFGKCVFMDTTFLPGTIVFDAFGHGIQLIPRTLSIDKKEIPWRSGAVIAVTKTNASDKFVR